MDKKSLIVQNNPKSPISEAYRVLRTNLQFSSYDKPLNIVVVTSSGPGEGKTTTIANLAVTFAQTGSKVLLIDADLRRPRIHKVFGFSNARGLSNYLASRGDYRDYLEYFGPDKLDILTCGAIPPNPSELLSSNAMKQFLAQIKQDYDIVLIDAPPVGTVTDAAILSTVADGTILVVSSGHTIIEAVKRSKELLEKVNAHIIGVVLTNVDMNSPSNYYYYYNYYYGETFDEPLKKRGKKIKKVKKAKKTKMIGDQNE